MVRLACVLIGYVCGLLQTGYIYGKLHNVDIRTMGSGNAGTTNALRTMGLKAGLITFLGDCLKCVIAVLIVRLLFGGANADNISLLSMYAGMGAVFGHNYPFYLGFKGGKGIAATSGLILSTMNPICVLICLGTFVLVVGITRYVSLGSLLLMLVYFAEVCYCLATKQYQVASGHEFEMVIVALVLVVSAFYKHKANIKRLLTGTENKLSVGKKN